ncbi:glycosyl hydrolase [Timonella sp. A28]|uniref:glycosyl hydrolase n=1 Tax=Timonella sp. A28 TaxID=3442640 RepID=UPI003EB7000C
MSGEKQAFSLVGYNLAETSVGDSCAEAIHVLPVTTGVNMPLLHGGKAVLPPTNSWFSGLAFGSSDSIFPFPYSYIQTAQGFVYGLPRVTTSRHTISGPAAPDIDVSVGASSYKIAHYDAASVTIEFLNKSGRVLGRAVLAEGVPYVSYTAEIAHDVTLSEPFAMTYETCATARVEGARYGLVTTGKFSSQVINLAAGQYVSLFAFPHFLDEVSPQDHERLVLKLAHHAMYPIVRTEVSAHVREDAVETTIRYIAVDNGPVAVARMPHQRGEETPILGLYTTVYGTVDVVSNKRLTWMTPKITPTHTLDISAWSPQQRARVVEQVRSDMAVAPNAPLDTFFGGKALYREAHIAYLADVLQVEGAAEFRAGVEERFKAWCAPSSADEPRGFLYDETWRGVVGKESSFGADEFNDHHVQYGYFLYVAALLCEANPALLDEVHQRVDALVWDIASPLSSDAVPLLRVFDPYKGHSWAAGVASSDDGNHQQSVFEAVNAWNAVALWAQTTQCSWMYDLAVWMLSLEFTSAQTYWTNFDHDDPVREAFQHSVVPFVSGGKHDYASWFGGEKSALLGLLIVPMSPVAQRLASDAARIRENVVEAFGFFPDFEASFGDYAVMYAALCGGRDAEEAWEIALRLSDDVYDGGNSKSYTLAWIASCCAS